MEKIKEDLKKYIFFLNEEKKEVKKRLINYKKKNYFISAAQMQSRLRFIEDTEKDLKQILKTNKNK